MFRTLLFLIILHFVIALINAATITEMETLHTSLFTGYNKNVRPITNQNTAINVNIYMSIKSIREFDEVDERFSFVAALVLVWTDEKLQWDPSVNGGIEQLTVAFGDVWVPEMTLSSPSSKGSTIGKSTDRIRVDQYGQMEWIPADLIESTCSVNARKFPFDTQSCDTSFTSLGYKSHEVNLLAGMPNVSLDVYTPHSVWDVTGSKVNVKTVAPGNESEITFTIKLKRDSTFAVINIIMPISILSMLNVLVFLLVPESGERIGYCITTLLAIAVYMTIVNDLLPQTSKPVPLISYKLFIDLFISALIVCVTILNMRLYSRDDSFIVPAWLKSMYRFFTCTRRKISKISRIGNVEVEPVIVISSEKSKQIRPQSKSGYSEKETIHELEKSEDEGDLITWKKISYMVDWIVLFTSIFMSLLNVIIFVGLAKS
ncbi:acetylcholine receptor subunit beta-type acr-3-like [Ruditapes philippinarum]|uniref:acetylcholine receptor subunit beta-type acr-3-like n=1 Tax=Ruditapes philippinarum TaxID=129788 RepID=UPI00295BED19|nr:acetylcholine receptor subunit beta-type acr-3-like [Ruditapes philippinarum]